MLIPILLSVVIVSLIALIGVITLAVKEDLMTKWLQVIVAFAAGVLLGAAFFDLIPGAVHELGEISYTYVLGGILAFFILERFIFWHHCHVHEHEVEAYTYLNIVGDAVHNFVDGAIIAAAYLTDFGLGIITTVAIGLHEIPQEIGDFAILVHGGFDKVKALWFNFLSALTAVAGAVLMFVLAGRLERLIPSLVAVAGGGFIYIATTDLFPELHGEEHFGKLALQTVVMLVGIFVIYWITGVVPHTG